MPTSTCAGASSAAGTSPRIPCSVSISQNGASARGARGEFLVLEAPDWVNVVAVTRSGDGEDCFLMVRQFRHGAQMITTEFPAGLIEPGEDPLAAARRELEEETGYRAGKMTLIGKVSPNPGLHDELVLHLSRGGPRRWRAAGPSTSWKSSTWWRFRCASSASAWARGSTSIPSSSSRYLWYTQAVSGVV